MANDYSYCVLNKCVQNSDVIIMLFNYTYSDITLRVFCGS